MERLKPGDFVRTIQDAGRDDWQRANRSACLWGATGQVLKHSDAHGLCYLVRHGDGTEVWYDHDELARRHPWLEFCAARRPTMTDEHAWFKRFMGMPKGGGVSGGKSGVMMLLLFIGFAAMVAWLLNGCQAFCVSTCSGNMNDCFEHAKTGAERRSCLSGNEDCVRSCAGTHIRVRAGKRHGAIDPGFADGER